MTCAVLITPLVDVVPIIEGCDYIGVDAGALKIIDQGLPIKMAGGDFDSFYWDIKEKVHSLLMFDVVEIDAGISEELRKEIKKDGVVIYEKA